MVDFNSEGTVSKPSKEIVALIIIEKLYNFLEADEHYAKTRMNGAGISIAVPRARLRNLFLICNKMLERKLKPDEFQEVACVCMNLKEDCEVADLISAFMLILKVLDEMQLIKLDTKPVYERHKIEEANKQHGY